MKHFILVRLRRSMSSATCHFKDCYHKQYDHPMNGKCKAKNADGTECECKHFTP